MIDHNARTEVYKSALSYYGTQLQSVVALEELSEAQKEICKFLRGCGSADHLAEEIADACIVLEQLCLIYGVSNSVVRYIDVKVQRLAERIQKAKAYFE